MLRVRAISAIAVVLVAIVPAIFGSLWMAVAFVALGLLALHELAAMLKNIGYEILWVPAALVVVVAIAAGLGNPFTAALGQPFAVAFMPVVAVAVLLPGAWLIFRRTLDGTLAAWLGTTFAALFVAVPLMHAVALRSLYGGELAMSGRWLEDFLYAVAFGPRDPYGHLRDLYPTARGMAWLLFCLVTVWFTDVGAYAAGRAFGRRSFIPHVSPNKTWEGFFGGLIGGALAAAVTNYTFGVGMPPPVALVAGVAVAGVATAGDLAESLLKRQAGVKDSGTLIPGHGGVLDRMDSQLYAFVFVYYLALLVG